MKQDNKAKAKDGQEIVLIELSSYVKPEIKEVTSKDWVLNGSKNSFFSYIIDRYNGSPTNAAIVNGFTELIYGKGLIVKPEDVDRMAEAQEQAEQTQLDKYMGIFPDKEIRRIVSDFKLFGSAAAQIVYSKGRGSLRKVTGVYHIPRETVAPQKMDEDGDINGYYYSKDWSKATREPYTPEYFPAFGTSEDAPIEIMVIEPYKAGKHYFADPDYLSALQYANLEEEISNYSISHIQNGLSAGYIINFNNGVPTPEKREEIKRSIRAQLQGSSAAGNVIIAFNDAVETGATVVPIPSNATHEQWQFWTGEARAQIMVGHRVISPMLFGVKDNSGLGNNADELETASRLLYATVISPMQKLLTESFEKILAVNGIDAELYFEPLMIFTKEDGSEQQVEETVELRRSKPVQSCSHDVNLSEDEALSGIADDLISTGEDIDMAEWELIQEEDMDGEPDDLEELLEAEMQKLQLAFVPSSSALSDSEQDTSIFKVRYKYFPERVQLSSREFCIKMVNAGKIYRKEDITAAGNKAVNAGFGLSGAATYSIWLYKGGARCHHLWRRQIFLKRNDQQVTTARALRIISGLPYGQKGEARLDTNDRRVSTRPVDMPNEGFAS